ncbi:MAG: hypothetical protein IJE71_08820 [Clostridia bacterium]|nr:hypothetical protein [Clostridia bacterium]
MRFRFAAACAALLALLPLAAASGQTRAYGGSRADILLEAIACEEGAFAAGRTASSDMDLAMRTRETETGWAVRLDGEGDILWSYCTGRAGMQTMVSPAETDEGFSLVLTDEMGARGEWITLSREGELIRRIGVPAADVLCAHGGTIRQMLPAGGRLYVLLEHEDGTQCMAEMDKDGDVTQGAAIACGADARLVRTTEGAACAGVLESALCIADGSRAGSVSGAYRLSALRDALVLRDGSLLACGEAEGEGAVMRVSAAGEMLFCRTLPGHASLSLLTETDMGFAALGSGPQGSAVLFMDEDGALLGEAEAPERTLDLIAAEGGAAALSHDGAPGRRQAMFTLLPQPEADAQQGKEQEELEPALLIGDVARARPREETVGFAGGHILCSASDAHGVRVAWIGEDGKQRFSTRIPIHTAADELEWLCAARLQDGVLLGGRYLTGEGDAMRQQGVVALLGEDGVLRRIETIAGGAVLSMELVQGGALLHIAGGDRPGADADTTALYPL